MYDECETSRPAVRHRQGCNLGEHLKYARAASSCSFVHTAIVSIAVLSCSSEPQCGIIIRILSVSSHTVADFCKGCKMSRVQIGRTVRRLRTERNLSQQALANRLGISASYLNLIEHDQRTLSGALLIKLGEALNLDLAELSGTQERRLEIGLREAFSDPLLGADAVPEEEIAALAASAPNAGRAVLALYRAWRVAREDAAGIGLPSGRC